MNIFALQIDEKSLLKNQVEEQHTTIYHWHLRCRNNSYTRVRGNDRILTRPKR